MCGAAAYVQPVFQTLSSLGFTGPSLTTTSAGSMCQACARSPATRGAASFGRRPARARAHGRERATLRPAQGRLRAPLPRRPPASARRPQLGCRSRASARHARPRSLRELPVPPPQRQPCARRPTGIFNGSNAATQCTRQSGPLSSIGAAFIACSTSACNSAAAIAAAPQPAPIPCPVSPSTSAISCYAGQTVTPPPALVGGGICDCSCGPAMGSATDSSSDGTSLTIAVRRATRAAGCRVETAVSA